MADGNNFDKKYSEEETAAKSLVLEVGELAASAIQSMEQIAGAIQSSLCDAANVMAEKVAKANNSRIDVKFNLAEGILNGLFCGSLITVNIHNYAVPPQSTSSEAAKTEES